ncbi:MAG: ADP-forming succinate--CoA ligase subunit beta [Promethearchaeati archaeon SRVP18_Atabeyarchaeia-1]
MRFFEYEAKSVFEGIGIPVPRRGYVTEPEAAKKLANEIGCPVVLKAQVLVGGRGKAGGIKFADTPDEAEELARMVLGTKIHGLVVGGVLVEEKLRIQHEFYIGITIDRSSRKPVALASSMGGMDIEEVAKSSPEKIVRRYIDPLLGMCEFEARMIARKAGFADAELGDASKVMLKLWRIMREYDAELVESNPFVRTEDGRLVAADARLNVDDNSLFRHKDLESRVAIGDELNEREAEAREAGMSYVELEGNVSIIGNGAGLVMATLDMVDLYGGKPANFLDVGGGAASERMLKALQIVSSHPNSKVILINILGGITRCDEMAVGIIEARNKVGIDKPLVVRMVGTNEAEGRSILNKAGIEVLDTMEDAAMKAVQVSR